MCEAGNQLIDIFFSRIGPNNKHHFIQARHPVSFSAGITSAPATAAGISHSGDSLAIQSSEF